jgi:hypothetical protein
MKEYNWDGRILQETKSKSKSKLQQSWYYNRIVTAAEADFNTNSKRFIQPYRPDKEGKNLAS